QKHAEDAERHDRAVAHLSHRFDIEDRLVAVNRLNLAAHRRGQSEWLRLRARNQEHRIPRLLRQWQGKNPRPPGGPPRLYADPDHLHPGIAIRRTCEANVFADGVAVGPETLRQSLVNDDHSARIRSVRFGEATAPNYGGAHRFEIIRRADTVSPAEFLSGRRI